jgi:hypothetical protein
VPPGSEPGREQQRRDSDEHRLNGECGSQAEVVGQAAEEVGGGDDQGAAEKLDGSVGGVTISWRGGQGEGDRERIEISHAEPAEDQAGDRQDR